MKKIILLIASLLLCSCQYDGIGSNYENLYFSEEPAWIILKGTAKFQAGERYPYVVWFYWKNVDVYYKLDSYPFDIEEARKDESLQEWQCERVWCEEEPVVPQKS